MRKRTVFGRGCFEQLEARRVLTGNWADVEVLPPPHRHSDLDGDGEVGFGDFLQLSSNFGTQVSAGTGGDLDADGTVGFADFLILSNDFGKRIATSLQLIRVNANMLVEDPSVVLDVAKQARDAGATGIVLADSKLSNWWLYSYRDRYESQVQAIIASLRDEGLNVYLTVRGLGYCSVYHAQDPNLANGYPIQSQPLQVKGARLVPVETATVTGGDFERTSSLDSNLFVGARFQDAVGERTFQDRDVFHSGASSLRAEASPDGSSRYFTNVDVLPWQQYTLKVWVKTENLTASNWQILIRDDETKVARTSQFLSTARESGGREYFKSVSDYSSDWNQVQLSFNSGDSTNLDVALGIWGGQTGIVWWDDLRIEATPTMNWLNRDTLPQSLETGGGDLWNYEANLQPIIDPLLGQSRFQGTFDNYHEPPSITLTAEGQSLVSDGDVLYLNGYHTQVTRNGQVGCTWHDPQIYEVRQTAIQNLWESFAPDGIMIGDNEIRTGGAEPMDRAFASTGESLAAHYANLLTAVDSIMDGQGKIFMWSDMFDPGHNARAGFY